MTEELQRSIRQKSLELDIAVFHHNKPQGISRLLPVITLDSSSFPVIQIGTSNYSYDEGIVSRNSDVVMIDTIEYAPTGEIESLDFDYGIISANTPQYATELKRLYQKSSHGQTRSFFNKLLTEHNCEAQLPSVDKIDDFRQIVYEKMVQ
jgi:hypothetical protein